MIVSLLFQVALCHFALTESDVQFSADEEKLLDELGI